MRVVGSIYITEVVNLTPHEVVFVTRNGKVSVPPSGVVARLSTKVVPTGTALVKGMEVPLTRTEYGEVEGLPEKKDGVLLIVSALVRTRLPERYDLSSPGGQVRDEAGKVVGASSLDVN